nr:MAG TPA: hypothetical protein [Caudoviricetes sp.]
MEHHNTGHLEYFPGVPIFSPFRRFSPVFSLFGGSASRVGRRSAESRVAPHNRPDPITTCRRNGEKRCRRNALPPIRRIVEKSNRRNVTKTGKNVSSIRRFEGKQGDGAAAHTDIRAAEKKLKWENYVYKIF